MSKILSKSWGFVLLLVILVAGFFWYRYQNKDMNPQDMIHPHAAHVEDKHSEISGTVIKYGSNHEGDIDKLLLSSDEEEIWLHFPPHTARQVTSVAIINGQVEALINRKGPLPPKHRHNSYELGSLTNNVLQTKVDLAKIPAPIPRKGIEIEIKGSPLFNRNANTFLLAGKMVTLPPHMAQELFPLINHAKTITVKGYMRDSTDGFLSDSGLPVVKPSSVKIDSVIYKIR